MFFQSRQLHGNWRTSSSALADRTSPLPRSEWLSQTKKQMQMQLQKTLREQCRTKLYYKIRKEGARKSWGHGEISKMPHRSHTKHSLPPIFTCKKADPRRFHISQIAMCSLPCHITMRSTFGTVRIANLTILPNSKKGIYKPASALYRHQLSSSFSLQTLAAADPLLI